MNVIVCGGRDFRDYGCVSEILGKIRSQFGMDALITGGARGADEMAEVWSKCEGIKLEVYRADWQKYGRAAGPVRNQKMVELAAPDLVVAFPGGRGTSDMVKRAMKSGIPVALVENDESGARFEIVGNSPRGISCKES